MADDTIKIRNTTRNQIILGQTKDADGKPQDVILGSTDDQAVAGQPQPEIELAGKLWDKLSQNKAIRHLVDVGQIVVYG